MAGGGHSPRRPVSPHELSDYVPDFSFLRLLLSYIHEVTDQERFEEFRAKMNKIPELEAHVATMAEVLRAEGREVGREEGRQAMAASVLRLVERDFGPLSETDRQRLERASFEQLQVYLDRVLTAERIADVLGED